MAMDATALYRWAKAAGSVYQEELASPPVGPAGGGLGTGPQRLPGDDRAQRGAAAGLLETDRPDRSPSGRHRRSCPADGKARMRADEAASVATRARQGPQPDSRPAAPPLGTPKPSRRACPSVTRCSAGRDPAALRLLRLVGRSCGRCSTGWSTPRSGCAPMGRASARPRWSRRWPPGGRADSRSPISRRCRRAFLHSDRVVRLVNRDNTGRAPGQWSTVAHRRLEDRVLGSSRRICNSGRRRRSTLPR